MPLAWCGAVKAPGAPPPPAPDGREPRLLDRVRAALRVRGYSPRTERAYVRWVVRFVAHHGMRHPGGMGAPEIHAFLEHLAGETHVAASTQNQALAAVLFLYGEVLRVPIGKLGDFARAKRPHRLPVVLTRGEVQAVLARLGGTMKIIASLLYGSGLRLLEVATLRVKDIDLERLEIVVRDGKGRKDRVTTLPRSLVGALRDHLGDVWRLHERDLVEGAGWVELPDALRRKYPSAAREWPWQWVFPATRTYVHAETGEIRRHHLHETAIQRAVREAGLAAGIGKAGSLPWAAALVRDPPPRGRHRHPDDPGAARPQGPEHDDDLHPRAQPRWARGAQPARPAGGEPGLARRRGRWPRWGRGGERPRRWGARWSRTKRARSVAVRGP